MPISCLKASREGPEDLDGQLYMEKGSILHTWARGYLQLHKVVLRDKISSNENLGRNGLLFPSFHHVFCCCTPPTQRQLFFYFSESFLSSECFIMTKHQLDGGNKNCDCHHEHPTMAIRCMFCSLPLISHPWKNCQDASPTFGTCRWSLFLNRGPFEKVNTKMEARTVLSVILIGTYHSNLASVFTY